MAYVGAGVGKWPVGSGRGLGCGCVECRLLASGPYCKSPGSHRSHIYSERYRDYDGVNYDRSIRDGRYKIIRIGEGYEGWFDLHGRVDDGPDLRPMLTGSSDAEPWLDVGQQLDDYERDLGGYASAGCGGCTRALATKQ